MRSQNTLKLYLKQHIKTVGIISLFTFFFCIFRILFPTISYDTDEWLAAPQNTLSHWLAIGRYSLVLLKYCFGTDTSLLMLNIVTYVNVGIYTVLFLYFLNIDCKDSHPKKDCLCGIALISSPIFLEQYYFTLQCAEVSFAMILIVLSFIATYKLLNRNERMYKKGIYGIVIFLLLVFTFGIYQTFINLYVIGALICLYKHNTEDSGKNMKNIAACFLIFLISLLAYLCISKLAAGYFQIAESGYLGIQWLNGNFPKTLKRLIVTIGQIILGYGSILNLAYTFCLMFAFYVIFSRKKRLCWKNFYLLALLASPFLLNILTAANFVVRSVLGFPILCAFIFWELFEAGRLIRFALYAVAVSQITHSELLLYSDYLRSKNDAALAEKIYADCNADADTVIVFKGIHSSKSGVFPLRGQVMGRSFFEWCPDNDQQNADGIRILFFMQSQGLYASAPTPEQIAVRNTVEFTGSYPKDGYLVEKDGIFYVNLGTD